MTSRYGRDKQRHTRCSACKVRFSERKGTPLFDSRLPPEQVESVLEHIAEGGVRQTGRLCKVNRNTVGRLSRLAGDHARDLHRAASWSRFPRTRGRSKPDEKWPRRQEGEELATRADPADDHKGDTWDHVAFDAESRLVVSVVPGERTAENVVAVVEDFKRRTGGLRDGPDHHRRLSGL